MQTKQQTERRAKQRIRPTERLRGDIIEQGRCAVELRQVNIRLRALLPQHLQRINNAYRQRGLTPARALRAALTDTDYLEHLNAAIDIGAKAHAARLHQELSTMRYAVSK